MAMMQLVDGIKEQEEYAKLERNLMRRFGISYTELQSIPMKVIRVWLKQEKEEIVKKSFEMMKNKNARTNH